MSNIYRQDSIPSTAETSDRWVDSLDEEKIYVCLEGYSSTDVQRSFTISANDRPGSQPLVLSTIAPHYYSSFEIVDGGASGAASAGRTGSGIDADPYHYTITVFDDSNSNDDIIAVLVAQPSIEASGSDATDGTVTAVSSTDLEANLLQFWALRNIWARFVAIPPVLNQVDTSIPAFIPPTLRNVLPEMVAMRLAGHDGGGDLRRTGLWAARVERAKGITNAQMRNKTNTISGKRYF